MSRLRGASLEFFSCCSVRQDAFTMGPSQHGQHGFGLAMIHACVFKGDSSSLSCIATTYAHLTPSATRGTDKAHICLLLRVVY